MGTKVHLFDHHSMRDLNKDCRLPLLASDQCYNQYDNKDVVRRTMLEHEAVFKTQVLELHRVYRIQKDMMDELKRKQFNKEWSQIEASCSSQATNDDVNNKWKIPSLPNSVYDRPSMSVVEDNGHSPMKGSSYQGVVGPVAWQNGATSSKNVEASDVIRPMKIRKKMIDLCLPADEYIDDDTEGIVANGNVKKTESRGDSFKIDYGLSRRNGLADLNEPFKAQETTNEFAYGHSRSVREHAPVISMHPNENGKPKLWPHQPVRIDHYGGTPFHQPGKPLDSSAQPMEVLMNSSQRVTRLPNPKPPSLWRERTFIDLEADTDTNTSHESSLPSQLHFYPYNPRQDSSAVPWNHLHSSWQNPNIGFPQNAASGQRYALSGNAQKIQFDSNSRFNSSYANTVWSNHNECSSSSSKSRFCGNGYNYPNEGINGFKPVMDSNGYKDLNLNVTFSNTSVVEVRKNDEQQHLATTLPWLVKPIKPACNNEAPSSSLRQLDEALKLGSCSSRPESKVGTFRMLDINEPGETLSDEEQQTMTKVSVSNFDLNLLVSEEEDENTARSVPTSSRLFTIDLETIPEPDIEEEEETPIEDEFEKIAAETIIAISSSKVDTEIEVVASSSEASLLHWFAEKIDTLLRNPLDYFESMTLQLPETTEEDYMPKPLVPEELRLEETATVTCQRPRRGNARKGKQRRDFQRDILPGMLSLSKHEVTEDIQMFDGLMRATGSSWTPNGLVKKKTGSRGRPRKVLVPPPPSVRNQSEIGLVEDGSFGGWGKMTRRPRRQRCAPATTSNQRLYYQ